MNFIVYCSVHIIIKISDKYFPDLLIFWNYRLIFIIELDRMQFIISLIYQIYQGLLLKSDMSIDKFCIVSSYSENSIFFHRPNDINHLWVSAWICWTGVLFDEGNCLVLVWGDWSRGLRPLGHHGRYNFAPYL